jgi:hypothetical protein
MGLCEEIMKRNTIFIIIALMALSMPAYAETIIYENLTSSGYKYITIQDNTNLKYINEYVYDVTLNGYYLGAFKKGDKIFYPNNSAILITFTPPISSEVNQDLMTTVIKPTLMLFLGFLFTWGLGIILLFIVIRKLWTDYIKRR